MVVEASDLESLVDKTLGKTGKRVEAILVATLI
jgi:hypothetical protein